MRKKIFIILTTAILVFSISIIVFAYDPTTISFGGPQGGSFNTIFDTPMRDSAIKFSAITSKYGQPRNVDGGSNPHTGIDQRTRGTYELYPVYNAKVVSYYTGDPTYNNNYIRLQIDINKDGVYDDNLYVEYWHISKIESGIYNGKIVGKYDVVAYTSYDHLDFRFKSNVNYPEGTKYVSLPAYSYLLNASLGNWNNAKDLDYITYPGSTYQNTVYFYIYPKDENGVEDLSTSQVKLYHRLQGQTTWNGPVQMTKSGSYQTSMFSINYKNLSPTYTTGKTVELLVSAERTDVANTYTWYPGKWQNKSATPDSTFNKLSVVVQ